ncbi:MAG: hypothetical protein HC799_02170 [Limnothrix sp. RL_2_0]|nr:hypothetical protein [Limnothrix sp. RL_2_0]
MARRHFLELARQGETQAIATLINRNLHPKGILAVVKYDYGYLQICLEGDQIPRQATLVNFIRAGLQRLAIEGVRLVQVYGRCKGQSLFGWHDCFTLTENPPRLQDLGCSADSLKKLARQGDDEAIALLLNEALSHKHWSTTVSLKDHCLKVNIYGEQPPESVTAVTLATRLIAKIRSPFFHCVEIRGYGTAPELLQWLDCFDNDDEEIRAKTTAPSKVTNAAHAKTTRGSSIIFGKLKTWF